MILKLGYTDVDGIDVFRYIEDFQELKITSFLRCKYKCHFNGEKHIITYDNKHEVKGVDMLFNPVIFKENEVESEYVNYIYFLDNKTNTYHSYACLSDSVFLMNDNGKTIDKY